MEVNSSFIPDPFSDSCNDVINIILRLLFGPKRSHLPWFSFNNPQIYIADRFKTWHSMQLTCKRWKTITDRRIPWGSTDLPLYHSLHFDVSCCLPALVERGLNPWRNHRIIMETFGMKNSFDVVMRVPFSASVTYEYLRKLIIKAIEFGDLHVVEELWKKSKDRIAKANRFVNAALRGKSEQITLFVLENAELSDEKLIKRISLVSAHRGWGKVLKMMERFISHPNDLHPALVVATCNDQFEVVDLLINELHVDPSLNDQHCLKRAMSPPYRPTRIDMVCRILNDERVNPRRFPYKLTSLLGLHMREMDPLLNHPRIAVFELQREHGQYMAYMPLDYLEKLLHHPKVHPNLDFFKTFLILLKGRQFFLYNVKTMIMDFITKEMNSRFKETEEE